ncbi:N-acylneuraminate cytidylyltransferase [Tumebacillus sp. BK434]|uniref:acylneuraminate cytidylyltransferase family protein n=1 Tax=Tumebacillus sp. BK434 TaxID=2512169 RepID=UPI0010504457|nr:acylneuraminate cytidylyltransferase family protein [Tumebacillus sp. BK434]TCP57851.1 N-acylneuraminate cytidylyltransferase [Tumebacillus sp. BK434]
MIGAKRVLAVIPARGGSKGVPRKNIRELAGKPLLAWSIEAARQSKYIDRVILSSDDPEIIETAQAWGCEVPFIRPAELAADDTPGIDPILHALSQVPGYDYVILLQPTSPLRTAEDIDACVEQLLRAAAPCCVTVTEPAKSPYWMYTLQANNAMQPLIQQELVTRRQDLPKAFALNGAVYVAEAEWLKRTKSFLTEETVAHIMPSDRSFDIDTELDLFLAEALLKQRVAQR